ncbi:uncharacterized protein METZ01_LOCUS394765 [marine metagenome]|uniref:Uncharacterized protein n=1 Tax=marine metagenome TaxID=408172 RepID=A0A382V7K7_9ZZZZ
MPATFLPLYLSMVTLRGNANARCTPESRDGALQVEAGIQLQP